MHDTSLCDTPGVLLRREWQVFRETENPEKSLKLSAKRKTENHGKQCF